MSARVSSLGREVCAGGIKRRWDGRKEEEETWRQARAVPTRTSPRCNHPPAGGDKEKGRDTRRKGRDKEREEIEFIFLRTFKAMACSMS